VGSTIFLGDDQAREIARLGTLEARRSFEHFFDGLAHRGEKLLQLRSFLNVPGTLESGTVLIVNLVNAANESIGQIRGWGSRQGRTQTSAGRG